MMLVDIMNTLNIVEFSPEKLRNLRSQKGLSLQQLAENIGVKRATISNYENSQGKPSIDVLIKLANFFNVDVNYFFKFVCF
jgi:transcriptional regulator with XRE-family HTH domain